MDTTQLKAAFKAHLLPILGVFVLSSLFHGALEFQFPDLFGYDGYYHIKIARFYGNGEVSIFGGDFHWAHYSSYGKLRHDWQLGYHLALIPFTWFGLLLGAKLSVVAFAALLVCVVFSILRIEKIPGAFWIALLFMVASTHNVWRIHLPRPTTLFLSSYLLTAWAASKNHRLGTFLGTLISLWIYNVPHSLIALAGISVAFVSWQDGKFAWRLTLAFLAGLALGVVIHPGFWHWQGSFFSLRHGTFVLWEQINGTLAASMNGNQVLVNGQPCPIGSPAEFATLPARYLKDTFQLPFLIFGVVLLLKLARPKKSAVLGQITLTIACLFMWLFMGSSRFSEYFVPFLFVGVAVLAYQTLEEELKEFFNENSRLNRFGPYLELSLLSIYLISTYFSPQYSFIYAAAFLLTGRMGIFAFKKAKSRAFDFAFCAIWLGILSVVAISSLLALKNTRNVRESWPKQQHTGFQYAKAMNWLNEHAKKDELVFHTSWDDFAPMFFYNHKNRYLVSFDSYFFYQHNPVLYQRWVRASYGADGKEKVASCLDALGVHYVFSRRKPSFGRFLKIMTTLPNYDLVYADQYTVLFRKKK
jgi:hypothetical protein